MLRRGFALPSVLIASVVMMIVLATSATAVTTTRTALRDQHYNQLAKEAAESGILMAEECVNSGSTSWTNPLRPSSNCSGMASQCTANNCYIVKDDDEGLTTTFQVTQTSGASGVSVTATGTASLVSAETGAVWKTYTQILRAEIGGVVLTTSDISSGNFLVCAVLNHEVWCNGSNNYGQMGNGRVESFSERRYIEPERVVRQSGALLGKEDKFVRAGNQSACVVTTDNEIYCWGYAAYGMLGTGSIPTGAVQPLPARVQKPAGMTGEITDLALSYHGGCAIAGGDVWCWGIDDIGQTGVGGSNRSSKLVPAQTAVIGASRGIPVTDISSSAGSYTYCAVGGGQAYCWGENERGELGDNTTTAYRTSPTLVHRASGGLQGKTVTQVEVNWASRLYDESATYDGAVGGCGPSSNRDCYLQAHSCALTSDGQVYCWGTNRYGQLGQGSRDNNIHRSPLRVNGALSSRTVRDIAISQYTSCALTTDPDNSDRFYCWGGNNYGAGGFGNFNSCDNSPSSRLLLCSPYPVVMQSGGLQNKYIDSITAGVNRTCAVALGVSYCMGLNTWGQIGDGTTEHRNVPTEAKLFRHKRPLLLY